MITIMGVPAGALSSFSHRPGTTPAQRPQVEEKKKTNVRVNWFPRGLDFMSHSEREDSKQSETFQKATFANYFHSLGLMPGPGKKSTTSICGMN
ncbi:MAG: hypothetical protein ACRD1R_10710 [Acidobacteriota bacterium]